MASGTPVALRSLASDSKSSGGQIGSSTQYGFDAFMARDRLLGFGRRPGAIGVDLDRDRRARHLARRSDRLGGALVQLDVAVAALERARGVALHMLDIAVVLQERGVGLDPLALRRRRAASTPKRLRACRGCPRARCRGRSAHASRGRRGRARAAARSIRGSSVASVGSCPTARWRIQLSNAATTVGPLLPKHSPQPITPLSVATRT